MVDARSAGNGLWTRSLAREASLSFSQFSEVWLFRLLERNERNDDRGGRTPSSHYGSLSLPLLFRE